MTIRGLEVNDLEKIKVIHEKFYQEEFEFPNFYDKFLCAFIITDNSNNIISAGGVRTIAESVIITDKEYPITERREALLQVLDASGFLAARYNYSQLHAFVQDEDWERHLKKHGFQDCKGKAIFLNL